MSSISDEELAFRKGGAGREEDIRGKKYVAWSIEGLDKKLCMWVY